MIFNANLILPKRLISRKSQKKKENERKLKKLKSEFDKMLKTLIIEIIVKIK